MKTIILIIITVILAVIMIILPIALYKATDEGFSISLEGIILLEGLYIAGLFALYILTKGIKLSKDIEKERDTYENPKNLSCRIPNGEYTVSCEHWVKQEYGCFECIKKYKKMKKE